MNIKKIIGFIQNEFRKYVCNERGTFIGLSAGTIGTIALLGGGAYALSKGGGGDKMTNYQRDMQNWQLQQYEAAQKRARGLREPVEAYAKGILEPGYEAYSPEMRGKMFSRIQEQLAPGFEERMRGQREDISSQGITGTPGAAILRKLRRDYEEDLMGKATDIELTSASQTLGQKRGAAGMLSSMATSIAGGTPSPTFYAPAADTGGGYGEGFGKLLTSLMPGGEAKMMEQYLDILRKRKGGTGTMAGLQDIFGSEGQSGFRTTGIGISQ